MIDTIRLASPALSEATIDRVQENLIRRQAIALSTGDIQYEFTSGTLDGSWDSRVSVQAEREEWYAETLEPPQASSGVLPSRTWKAGRSSPEPVDTVNPYKGRKATSKRPCAPYLVIEGSIHKALMGHNVFGGPLPPALSAAWFIDNIADRAGVALPPSEDWRVHRVDWAEAYELPSFEGVQEYISGLNMASFPRREVVRHGSESLFAPGRTTTVKVYHKGPEFSAHDWKRVKNHVGPGELIALQERANRILRLETSIKARKLTDDFGQKPLVCELTQDYLERVHDREVARLLKEADTDMQTVRTNREVSRRLRQTYSSELANRLFGTWLQLAALGEKEVRQGMARPTFYRQRKQLVDAGCSWAATDVTVLKTSAVPVGFSPTRSDKYRLTDEAEQVRLQLYSYNRAA